MSDYIERSAVMQKFADYVKRSNNSDFAPTPTWNEAVQIVEDAPTADVVEAVRCQDCKWYKEGKLFTPKKFCFRLRDKDGKHIGYNFAPDDFCSYGERKGVWAE